MFTLSDSDKFYLYPFPTDMRKSFYSLSGIVLNEMHQDIQQGDEQLEVTAPDIWVNVTIRHKAMRKSDKKVITADCPMVPIPKSIAGVSLLTELIIGKYVDHLPFWRQIAQYKRLGYEIKQPTLESWFHEVANLMRPLYYRIQDMMLSMDYLQSDESTVPVINNEKHRAVKGYMWLTGASWSRWYSFIIMKDREMPK